MAGCAARTGDVPGRAFYERADGHMDDNLDDFDNSYSSLYKKTMDRIMDGSFEKYEGRNIFEKLSRIVLTGYYRAYYTVRGLLPVIVICSMTAGILIMAFSIHNKQFMRLGLFGFLIGIPLVSVLFVFGIGILNDMFLY